MNEVSSVLIGLASGALISWFNFRYIWINQKLLEAKLSILDDAAKALGLYQREALDPEIQSSKRDFVATDGSIQNRCIELSAETDILIRKTLVKTKAMFSDPTYVALSKVLNAPLNVENPSGSAHNNFISDSEIAIKLMGDELKENQVIRYCSFLKTIIKR